MDGAAFDRFAKTLVKLSERRDALKAVAGFGVVMVAGKRGIDDVSAKKRHKKKERKLGQTCGGQKKCSKKQGPAACEEFPSSLCQGVTLTGKRCCGLEGTICDPNFGTPLDPNPVTGVGNCSCCDPLFCGKQPDGEFRCQVEPT